MLRELRRANEARQREWDEGVTIDLCYKGLELGGEAGEALNKIKKLVRERLGLRGTRATLEELGEELADVVICADLIALHVGIDLERALVDKFNKTSVVNGFATRLGSEP